MPIRQKPNNKRLHRKTRFLVNHPVEAVEKVPKQIFGRDAEKNDLIECATINDLILGKGQVTLGNIVLTGQKDFSYRLVRLPKKWQQKGGHHV
jgi:hypothetical protein